MSRVDDLIQALCPDGVRYCRLGDVSTFQRGKQLKESDRIAGPYPVVTAGRVEDARHAEWNHPGPSITVTSHGAYAGHVNFWEGPIWLANNVFLLQADDQLGPRYFFYVLKSLEGRLRAAAKGGGVPYINVRDIESVRIPVPPLEVQREIVGVLDTFTQLEAELEVELEARRAQYEHYRDEVLSFDEAVSQMTLGDVIENLRTGLNPRQNFKLNTPGATNFYITVRELAGFSIRPTEKTDRVDDAGLARIQARSRLQAGDILFSGTGTIGRTALVHEQPKDWNIKEGVYVLTPKKDVILPRFLIHLLRSGNIRRRILGSADGSTVASVSMASLRRVLLPVPGIKEQARLVGLLDKFDALVNDNSIGLPAELAARRKQYEHYRDRLLSFMELTA